jgi:hypothetical protein
MHLVLMRANRGCLLVMLLLTLLLVCKQSCFSSRRPLFAAVTGKISGW